RPYGGALALKAAAAAFERTSERTSATIPFPTSRPGSCVLCAALLPEPLEVGSRRNGFVPARLPIDRESATIIIIIINILNLIFVNVKRSKTE
uniref:Uncharacterized protein n=1 Tax=Anopheles quadriannulatus TaxID=34691 RepID=A0A182XT23_ANOQN